MGRLLRLHDQGRMSAGFGQRTLVANWIFGFDFFFFPFHPVVIRVARN